MEEILQLKILFQGIEPRSLMQINTLNQRLDLKGDFSSNLGWGEQTGQDRRGPGPLDEPLSPMVETHPAQRDDTGKVQTQAQVCFESIFDFNCLNVNVWDLRMHLIGMKISLRFRKALYECILAFLILAPPTKESSSIAPSKPMK